jgi:hypothetical protein
MLKKDNLGKKSGYELYGGENDEMIIGARKRKQSPQVSLSEDSARRRHSLLLEVLD